MQDITNLDHYGAYGKDHPSVVGAYSFFTSDRINKEFMKQTLEKVLDSFTLPTYLPGNGSLVLAVAIEEPILK